MHRHEAEGKRLVFVLNKIGVYISLIHTLRLSAYRRYVGLRARARMRRHGSNTSATQPQHSPSDTQARISARTLPLDPRLRCTASSRSTNRARVQSVTVGVVGFPNGGKSSLINTLKRAKVRHRIRFEPGMFIMPLLTARCHEGVRRCSAAGTHEGIAVPSTRARPADRRLTGGHL